MKKYIPLLGLILVTYQPSYAGWKNVFNDFRSNKNTINNPTGNMSYPLSLQSKKSGKMTDEVYFNLRNLADDKGWTLNHSLNGFVLLDHKAKTPVIHILGATSKDEWLQVPLPKYTISNSKEDIAKIENLLQNPQLKFKTDVEHQDLITLQTGRYNEGFGTISTWFAKDGGLKNSSYKLDGLKANINRKQDFATVEFQRNNSNHISTFKIDLNKNDIIQSFELKANETNPVVILNILRHDGTLEIKHIHGRVKTSSSSSGVVSENHSDVHSGALEAQK